MSIAARALALVSRAAHSGTPPEEARTCGVILAKMIAEHGLQLHEPGQCQALAPAARASQPASPGRWIDSRFNSFCRDCARAIDVGDRVWWTKGQGVVCRQCRGEA